MRFGCGCLFGILLGLAIAGAGWYAYQVLQQPPGPPTPATGDARRAQQKIAAIAMGSVPRGTTVALSEGELNAFLARQLAEPVDGLTDLSLDLTAPPEVRLRGRARVAALLAAPALGTVRDALPRSWLERPVWLDVTAVPTVTRADGRRRSLRLDVSSFRVGRQRIPVAVARLMLDPRIARLLHWSLPETVEDVTVEKGRVVVRIGS